MTGVTEGQGPSSIPSSRVGRCPSLPTSRPMNSRSTCSGLGCRSIPTLGFITCTSVGVKGSGGTHGPRNKVVEWFGSSAGECTLVRRKKSLPLSFGSLSRHRTGSGTPDVHRPDPCLGPRYSRVPESNGVRRGHGPFATTPCLPVPLS